MKPSRLMALIESLRDGGARARDEDRYADFRAVFMGNSTAEQGRRVLWDILSWSGLFQPAYIPNEPHAIYVREGERALALRILAVLYDDPHAQAAPKPAEIFEVE